MISKPHTLSGTSIQVRTCSRFSALTLVYLVFWPRWCWSWELGSHSPARSGVGSGNEGRQCCKAGAGRGGSLVLSAAGLPVALHTSPPDLSTPATAEPGMLREPAWSDPRPWRPVQVMQGSCSSKFLHCNNPDLFLFSPSQRGGSCFLQGLPL